MVARPEQFRLVLALSSVALWTLGMQGPPAGLTSEDIEDAIAWGQSGRPEAYRLRSAFPANKWPAGVVYTPYLRVALASRAASEDGQAFTVEDVTREMTAPLLYIAIGDAGDDPLPPGPLPADTPLSVKLVTEHSNPSSPHRQEIPALWVRRTVPSFLRFGMQPTWSYVLAAFRVDQIKPDTRVELYREHREGTRRQVLAAPGLITEEDLRSWK